MDWIISTLLILLGAAVVLPWLGGWLLGSLLVYPAHRRVGEPPPELGAEVIALPSRSGSVIQGWWCEHPSAIATVVLFHGVRGNRLSMLARASLLREAGYSVLLIDFQAHGESRGSHLTFGYLERHDVSASLEFVRQRKPHHKIGVIGSSLGGAATLLGAPREINALVLEAVYPTIEEAIEDRARMRLGPLSFILSAILLLQIKPRLGITSDQLRPIEKIGEFSCPILVASGDMDLHTTLAETERLFARAPEPKELVIFKGAAHIDLLEHDRELYESKVLAFFGKYLTP